MNLTNEKVIHNRFGQGTIINCDDSYIEVMFSSGTKTFVFPDAFETYVTLINKKAAKWARQIKTVQEHKKQVLQAKKQNEIAKRERMRVLLRKKLAKMSQTSPARTIHPKSQAVFWCQPDELDRVFTEWKIATGTVASGRKKGLPRRLARVKANTACLLTARSPGVSEQSRKILGAFMVSSGFRNRGQNDESIPAHLEYRIRLSALESEKMLFWNYYVNEQHPDKIVWNSGRHRYFDNVWMAQILRDIVSLRKDPVQRDLAQRFLEYFCQANQLDANTLPQPDGALSRI